MSAQLTVLIERVARRAQRRAAERAGDIKRLGLPSDASDLMIKEALATERTAHEHERMRRLGLDPATATPDDVRRASLRQAFA